ncbi:DNA polymerase IV [Alteromonas sp. a30]|uniref:DNA polymerase IV n=1 Tax=Alteromonas sp. a30 TaxID=2730917 RepID=UPI00227F4645|nr:DNA polymerase IV [Alteromonas sp. a30]MCY7296175.1 DNA polymerase IV [Alteromonas sp. a30]
MRKIVHIDMDAFFVSVEIRDNPKLAGKPVAVGGKSDRRGVLSTCNYLARRFGVSSAMPTGVALRKCPDLIVVPGRMEVYREVSAQIRSIFERYTDLIEPLSLDEAYLDVSECEMHQGSATLIAQEIRQEIQRKTQLTASAGIAPVKFLAKIASDQNKPNGQFTLAPEHVDAFIETMPLKKIPGVGKVTNEKLLALGFEYGKDIRESSEAFLIEHFGKFGRSLWSRCQGIDNREIETSRIRKSVGVERTFANDISDFAQLAQILQNDLLPELFKRSAKHTDKRKINKLGVKVKFHDFHLTTKEHKYHEIDVDILLELLREAMARGEGKRVRLLGIHIGLEHNPHLSQQLILPF